MDEEVDVDVGQQQNAAEQQTSVSVLKLNYFGVDPDTDIDEAQDEKMTDDC